MVTRLLLAMLVWGDPLSIPGEDSYRALLIGINEYRQVDKLETPVKDVNAIGDLLRTRFGFKSVETLLDQHATEEGILSQLNRLVSLSDENQNLLIYFAGHGVVKNRTGYWVPQDGDASSVSTLISNSEVTGILRRMSYKHVLLIVDSCFSGNILDFQASHKADFEIGELYQRPSTWVVTSGIDTPVLDRSYNSPHSPFAHYLIRYLEETPEPYISPVRISMEVSRRMRADSIEQHPTHAVFNWSDDKHGCFFLWNLAARDIDGQPFKAPWEAKLNAILDTELLLLRGHFLQIYNPNDSDKERLKILEALGVRVSNGPGISARVSRTLISDCEEIKKETLVALRNKLELTGYKVFSKEDRPGIKATCGKPHEILLIH